MSVSVLWLSKTVCKQKLRSAGFFLSLRFFREIAMWIWKEAREKWMLVGALTSFVLVILINLKLEVWSFLKGGKISSILQADATGTVASDLFVGLCSAYVFYVFMELIPKYNREKESAAALNILLNAIFSKYLRPDAFRRIVRARDIDPSLLSDETISSVIVDFDENKGKYEDLKHMAEAASRRLPDLLSSFHLAAGISHEKGVLWMEITDATRSLSEYHDFIKDINKTSLEVVTDKEMFLQFRRQQADFFQDKKEGLRIVMQARAKEWLKLVGEWKELN
ncbi:hypothetical protein ACUZXZ_08300 [Pseudomonas juntendi]|uniref:hypothetical protein n=1 Tax=Pseudomonas juntendi TaxID=2666183 RepID=UPI001F29D8AA|nr:hypothetical protein [Pseudomonas juntendi]MCO7057152.1 hypothetical protein [Pseudomonas juntendi]UJM14037.1 hypothetical protein L1P09_07585 [Pseudomonas juntendi]